MVVTDSYTHGKEWLKMWKNFMHPHGRRRTLNPSKWEWRDRILVFGELLAVGAAIAAIPVELYKWPFAPWLIISATIVGTSALLWYAFDLISVGELPLTNQTAHKVRQVVSAMEMEKQGAVYNWENIDERGGIPVDLANWAGLRPELKAIMDRHGVSLPVAAMILSELERAGAKEDT